MHLLVSSLFVYFCFHLRKLEAQIELSERIAQELVHDAASEQAHREEATDV